MAKKMLIDATHPEETRVVVVDGNRVEEFDFESIARRPTVGNIYLAKVTRVEPSLQAAFVDYGGNRHGFLAFSEIHPDYYQIPVADREALLAEEAAEQERSEAREAARDDAQIAREEAREGRGDRRRRRRGRGQRARQAGGAAASAEAEETREVPGLEVIDLADEEAGEVAAEPLTGQAPAEGAAGSAGTTSQPERAGLSDGAVVSGEIEAPAEDAAEEAPSEETPSEETPSEATRAEETPSEATRAEEAPAAAGEAAEAAGADEDESEDEEDAAAEEAREGEVDSIETDEAQAEAARLRARLRRRYKIQDVIKVRQIMLVQVVKEERGNKGAALTTYLSLAGRYCVLMPNTAKGGGISRKITNAADRKRLRDIINGLEVPPGMGLIVRTAGAGRTKAEIKRDYEFLLRQWEQIRDTTLKSIAPTLIHEEGSLIKRAIRDLYSKEIEAVLVEGEAGYREAKDYMKMLMPSHARHVHQYTDKVPLFIRYQVESYLNGMFSPVVQLKSGGYIVISQTEALVAIDVNSGRSTREGSVEDTALKTNLEAAEEVARQLRLRDLAGLIVIDFIDMNEPKNNRAVEKRLKEKLKSDRARLQVGRISPFGLLEMSRQRLRSGMVEMTTQPCPHCHGQGVIRSDESMALMILREVEEEAVRGRAAEITAHAPVAVANFIVNAKRGHLAHIEERHGVAVVVHADPALISPEYRVERSGSREVASPEAEAVVAASSVEAAEAAREEKRRRRRGRRGGRRRKGGEPPAEAGEAAAESAAGDAEAAAAEAAEPAGESESPDEGGATPVAEAADEAAETGEGERRRRRRRGGRGRGRRAEEAATATEEPSETPVTAETTEDAASAEPAVAGEPEAAADAEAEQAPGAAAEEPEEKAPARRRRSRGRKTAAAEETATEAAAAEGAEAPEVVGAGEVTGAGGEAVGAGSPAEAETPAAATEPAESAPVMAEAGEAPAAVAQADEAPEVEVVPITVGAATEETGVPSGSHATSSAEGAEAAPQPAGEAEREEPAGEAAGAAPEEKKRPRRRGWWQLRS